MGGKHGSTRPPFEEVEVQSGRTSPRIRSSRDMAEFAREPSPLIVTVKGKVRKVFGVHFRRWFIIRISESRIFDVVRPNP